MPNVYGSGQAGTTLSELQTLVAYGLGKFADVPLALPPSVANNCFMAEADDIARAKSGDREAFGRLVRTHYRRIYSCVAHILGGHNDADDAAQEAFMRAYAGLHAFDGRSELATWLYRIAINTALNFRRKAKTINVIADVAGKQVAHVGGRPETLAAQVNTPVEQLNVNADLRNVLAKVCELSPTLRVTLILTTVEELPHKQVAEILGIPEGTVAWRVNEARRLLRLALGESEPEKNEPTSNFSQPVPKV